MHTLKNNTNFKENYQSLSILFGLRYKLWTNTLIRTGVFQNPIYKGQMPIKTQETNKPQLNHLRCSGPAHTRASDPSYASKSVF